MKPSIKLMYAVCIIMGLCSVALLVLSIIMGNSGVFALGFTFCIISGLIAIGVDWAFKEPPHVEIRDIWDDEPTEADYWCGEQEYPQ